MTVALYRRHRPTRFEDLIGQDVVADTLRNEVRAGTLAHAYLFAGTRGTGKTSTARILARAVNCDSPREGEPCGECRPCRELLDGTTVDVLEIDAASNRGIDEMRELRDKVKYLPASLRRKVYIIDEAHMLTAEAWNAFLKTLEEPPEHVLFVLATTEPHKVPETVRSRVQRFDFRRVSTASIAEHLQTITDQEGSAVDADALQLLARAAQGSVRDALSYLEQALALGERPVTVAAARRGLGLADPATLQALARGLAGCDAATALRAANAAFEAGADPRQLIRELARLARSAELCAIGYPEGAEGTEEEVELCRELADIGAAGFWLTALDIFATAEINLRQPVDARLQVELALLRLVRPAAGRDEAGTLEALETRLSALERGQTQAPTHGTEQPVTTTAPTTQAAPSEATHDPSTVEGWKQLWPMLVEAVNRVDVPLAGVLRDCRPLEAEQGHLVIGANSPFHFDRIHDPKKGVVLAEAASRIAEGPVRVETQLYGQEQRAETGTDPGVVSDLTQAVLDTFAGSRVTATRLREPGSSRDA